MIRIPAFLAAGIAFLSKCSLALFPCPSAGRPSAVDIKKFCMSMITRADNSGEMATGVDVVVRWIETFELGASKLGEGGRVRSNNAGEALCTQ